ncbi:AAA family ATPase [Legionella lansingensis]|uniref:Endonuclease GajA/Old nuclease/RecF-like AAA domain-containing protein n=1 Tax=Legionella lansingensis TaxID=45067 RepID=A0A0W0V753_9GAMM|nr:AAA family ATPase [Legionella lansingensis]KTD15928.1 hypothetical protein Llan_2618 [Legionella lansingensis]
MKFDFQNYGRIRQGAVELGDLTIICGRNNSGKTYVSYGIHSFLRDVGSLVRANVPIEKMESLEENGVLTFNLLDAYEQRAAGYKKASGRFVERLHDYFSVDKHFFDGASISVSPPSWDSEESLLRSSAAFAAGKYVGVKESGSSDLIVSADSNRQISVPASYSRATIGEWIGKAGIGFSLPDPFAITSERTGVSLFYKDLDLSRNRVIENLLQAEGKEVNLFDLVLKNSSRYALPVKENIDAVRAYESLSKSRSFLSDPSLGVVDSLSSLTGGGFSSEKEGLQYTFKIKGQRKKHRVPIYVASSAIKSMLLLDLFVRHVAARDSMLIIDEPELNLHPANQRKMAGLIVRMVNSGVRVMMTTHSDFIIREISARIALSSSEKKDEVRSFMSHHDLEGYDLISHDRVKAFSSEDGVISPISINNYGIEVDSINDEISKANSLFEDTLFFAS